MTTDELQCVDACNAASWLCREGVPIVRAPPGEMLATCAEVCDVTAHVLPREAGFGARDVAMLCSKLCRSAADLLLKASPDDATKELVEALIACADACHVVAIGTIPATS